MQTWDFSTGPSEGLGTQVTVKACLVLPKNTGIIYVVKLAPSFYYSNIKLW